MAKILILIWNLKFRDPFNLEIDYSDSFHSFIVEFASFYRYCQSNFLACHMMQELQMILSDRKNDAISLFSC